MSFQPGESIVTLLADLRQVRRPRLLLRSARFGLADYARERDLRRVLRLPAPPSPGPGVVRQLLALESLVEAQRLHPGPGAHWRAARHVEVLTALLAEARLMAEAVRPPGPAAPAPPRLAV